VALNSIFKNSILLLAGNSFSAVASFVRNIIIARLISVEDFGIAMLFALTMSAIEMASNLAIDKIIIQDKEGNAESFQATGQAFQLIRGFIGGIILFFSAKYVALFFKVPEAIWAFQLLALYPVIKGFTHLDVSRFQRKMNFMPLMWVEAIPLLVSLVLSWPLTIWLGDYSVMIWLLLLQVSLFVLLTHLLAERKFKLQWDSNVIKKIYLFGWPLLVNGILMFAILQGDKAIVGSMFTMETLGWYSVAFSLTLAPTMLLMKVSYSLLLPVLSKCRSDREMFKQQSETILHVCVLMGALLGFFFVLFGYDLLVFLFGEKYSQAVNIVAWLGLMQGIRLAKAGPMIVALASSDTKNPMISNSVRGLAFIIAIYAAWLNSGVEVIVMIAILGEMAAFSWSVMMLGKKLNMPLWRCVYIAVVYFLTCVFLIYLLPLFIENELLMKLLIVLIYVLTLFPQISSIRKKYSWMASKRYL